MKNLVIVGAGGFGREVLQLCADINKARQIWRILGFIDDNPRALDGYLCDYSVIGTIDHWIPSANEEFALAVAKPSTKEAITRKLIARGAKFATIIHPNVTVGAYTRIGEGTVIYPAALIGPNASIGNFTSMLSGVGHDALVDDYATVSSFCDICGHAHIGKRAFLGSHAVISPSLFVGDDAYVGAGSIVIRNVHAGKKVFGNPARVIDV